MLKHLLQIEYNNFLLLSLLEIVICKYLKIGMISLNQNLEFHRNGGAGFQCNFLVSVTREKNSIVNVKVLIEWKLDERKSTDHSATPIVLYTTSLYFFFEFTGHSACHAFCNFIIMKKCPCPEQSQPTIPMTTPSKMISMSFLQKLHSKDIMVSCLYKP